jgi:hypothetical protein
MTGEGETERTASSPLVITNPARPSRSQLLVLCAVLAFVSPFSFACATNQGARSLPPEVESYRLPIVLLQALFTE